MNEKFIILLERYIKTLNTKMKIENKSKNTIYSYNITYKSFLVFLSQLSHELTLYDIKEEHIYEFIEYKSDNLEKQGDIANATINAILSHLKKLFKHIERNSDELFDFDRVFEDIKVKQTKKKPKGLTKEEQKKLLTYLEEKIENTGSFIDVRNSLLVKLMMLGGLRVSESLSIKIDDIKNINNDYSEIDFIGKGNKERYTIMQSISLTKEMHLFCAFEDYDEEKPIALSKTRKPLNRSNLLVIVNRIYKILGIKKTGLHILRHTFAKNIVGSGKSVSILQALLGHSSLQTTSVYTNPTKSMIKDAITE